VGDRKKVLALFEYFSPAIAAGGPIKSALGFAEGLSEELDILIATRDSDMGNKRPMPGIVSDHEYSREGYRVIYLSAKKLKKNLALLILRKPDIVYLNSFFAWQFAILPLLLVRLLRTKSRLVLAPRGQFAASAISKSKWRKKVYLVVYRTLLENASTLYQASSEFEKKDILSVLPKRQVQVAGNLRPQAEADFRYLSINKAHAFKLCTIARIHPIKNIHLAIKCVLPLVPFGVKLDVYGFMEDVEYLEHCQQLAMAGNGNIRLLPALQAEDVMPTITNYHAFLLPTKGENFGHVIFEALLAGRPVIISDQTPWRNLQKAEAGFDLPLNNVDWFTNAIRSLMDMDQPVFDRWCNCAHQLATASLDHQNRIDQHRQLFEIAIANR
jgi:glycosyltransferase involved in cell wall biosynthesis